LFCNNFHRFFPLCLAFLVPPLSIILPAREPESQPYSITYDHWSPVPVTPHLPELRGCAARDSASTTTRGVGSRSPTCPTLPASPARRSRCAPPTGCPPAPCGGRATAVPRAACAGRREARRAPTLRKAKKRADERTRTAFLLITSSLEHVLARLDASSNPATRLLHPAPPWTKVQRTYGWCDGAHSCSGQSRVVLTIKSTLLSM
jgi:hypothetical protein